MNQEPSAPVNDELPTEEELLKAELKKELDKTEEEINTLRQVLTAKEQHAAELRKSLGMTTLGQMKAEITRIQSSQAYQKTQETLKSSGQATASFFSSIGSSVSTRFSEMKNSNTFKSLEERSEEHTSEPSHTVISYAVFCLKKKKKTKKKIKKR